MIDIARDITWKKILTKILPRRNGDLSEFFADTSLAWSLIGWTPERAIADSVQTAWNYLSFSQKPTIDITPLVSIILPTYNPKKEWIIQSIKSVLGQSYNNFELLIIDDASTNHTLHDIGYLIQSDPRIRIIRNTKNLKLVHTLNAGIKQAQWKYIARIDDDDIWSSVLKLEKQVEFMENNPWCGLCGTSLSTMDYDGTILDTLILRLSDSAIRSHLLKDSQFAHASVLIKKEALDAVWLYDPAWNFVEDYDLWLRIWRKYKLSNLPDNFLLYRINPNGESNKNSFKQKWMSLLLTLRYRNDYPRFYLAMFLKIPYLFLPKKLSLFILKIIKR